MTEHFFFPIQSGFPEACYRAVSTLAFVSPGDILPKILEQLRQDINLDVLSSLTEDEFGIWATPEGTAFVDGSSSFINLELQSLTHYVFP